MRKIIYILYIILLIGCNKKESPNIANLNEFLSNENLFYYSKSESFTFDHRTCQLSFNKFKDCIRYQNDNHTKYVNIEIIERNSSDLLVEITSKLSNKEKIQKLRLVNYKTQNNLSWYWDDENSIGIIICLDVI